MTKDQAIRLSLFKQEVSALCRKYSVGIDGCGCCGSPSLYTRNEEGRLEDLEERFRVDVNGEIIPDPDRR